MDRSNACSYHGPVTVAAVPVLQSQPSLFGSVTPGLEPQPAAERTELRYGAWVEYLPGWLHGDQALFDELVAGTRWHQGRRLMYDRFVSVPRLTAALPRDGAVPDVLVELTGCLESRYRQEMGSVSLALYRDGADSVAPHGDQIDRPVTDSVMAILSLGARRRFLLTPADGGGSFRFDLGHGDVLVMGGTIQRTWRHGVPKTNRPVGPRLSVMLRPPWMN